MFVNIFKRRSEMKKKIFAALTTALIISVVLTGASFAAEREGFGTKVKKFWRNLIGYPARVTEESASVVADTTKKSADVVSNSVKRVGEVTTGDVAKTKELITEPITGTAETVVMAGEGTIKVPSEALKDKSEGPGQDTETETK